MFTNGSKPSNSLVRNARSLGEDAQDDNAAGGTANEYLDPKRAEVLAALKAKCQYARALARRGRFSNARVIQEEVVEKLEAMFGNADNNTLEAMSDLVSTYHSERLYDKAQALAIKLLALQKTMFGEGTARTLATESMIARILHSRGKYLEAAELCHQILKQRQRAPTLEDPATLAEAFTAYGHSLLKLERYEDARASLCGSVWLYGLSGEDKHLDALDCKEYLAETFCALEWFAGAVELGHEVQEGRKKILGEFHAETIKSMSDLATYLCCASRPKESRHMILDAMGMSAKNLGMKHFTTISIWSNGATILRLLDDWKVARALAYRSFALSNKVKGTDHPETLSAISEVCWALQHDGNFSTARDCMALCVRHTGQFYGWHHPLTLRRGDQLRDIVSEESMHKTRKRPNPIGAFFKAVVRPRRERRFLLAEYRGSDETTLPLKPGKTLFYV